MRRRVRVSSRVHVRGAVAAADVAAGEADAQVQPLASGAEAILTAVHLGGKLTHLDQVEMAAGTRAHRTPAGWAERCSWTNWTAIEPSPTAAAQRLVEPERTSPAAKIPGMLVSSRYEAPAASPVSRKPSACRATQSPSHSVHGLAPRNRKRNENGRRVPSLSVTASRRPSRPCNSPISLRSRT